MFDQLKKWLSGEADWKAERRLDQLGKDDAFLQDAMDGYRSMPEADHSKAIAGLKNQLKGKYSKGESSKKRGNFNWTRLAAAAAFIGVIGLFFWTQRELPDSGTIAETIQAEEKKVEENIISNGASSSETKSLDVEKSEELSRDIAAKIEEKEASNIVDDNKKEPIIKPQLDPSNIEAGVIEEADLVISGTTDFDEAEANEEDVLVDVSNVKNSDYVNDGVVVSPEVSAAPVSPPVVLAEEAAYSDAEVPENEPVAAGKEIAVAKDESVRAKRKVERSMSTDDVVASTAYNVNGLKGTVVDLESGESMIGVSLYIKGTDNGTTTDFDGNYLLESDQPLPWTLIASYTGYLDQEFEINSLDEEFPITLEGGVELSEIVVTDYAVSKANKKARSKNDTSSDAKPVIGFKRMKRYVNRNLRYPVLAKENKIQGGVTIRFYIGEDGTPEELKILNTLGSGCDQEAKRLLEEGPKWEPTGVWAIYTVVFNL